MANDQDSRKIKGVPSRMLALESISPQGPRFGVVSPAKEAVSKNMSDYISTINGLRIALKLFDYADKLIPASKDPTEAAWQGVGRSIGSSLPGRLAGLTDENAATYKGIRDAFGTLMARAVGERGVVTNRDVDRILGGFAKFSDSSKMRRTSRTFILSTMADTAKTYEDFISKAGTPIGPTININAGELD